MKFKYFMTFTLIFNLLLSQQVSRSDLKKLQELSNSDLDSIREQLLSQPSEDPSNFTLDTDKSIENLQQQDTINIVTESTSIDSLEYFGYSSFERDINFFDNIPTPSNYLLGPGDEIIISLYGEVNKQQNFIISNQGTIYYDTLGFLNIANLSLNEAKEFLRENLSKIFNTLSKDVATTKIDLQVGRIKSINVYFTGMVNNKGIALIHPFSDVFQAIVQAGGVSINGSLRNISIIRNNKEIHSVDFYSFLTKGLNTFSQIKLLDGDIIHIPPVKDRVFINGATILNGYFEVLENENLSNLIDFSGGLSVESTNVASIESILSASDRVSEDYARQTQLIYLDTSNDRLLKNGDKIFVYSIPEVENSVQVFGRVKNPGTYPSNTNLKEVLDLAGGFNDPNFFKSIISERIIISRKNPNSAYATEFTVNYQNSAKFRLETGDKVFVYENSYYEKNYDFTIEGEVVNPGVYGFKENTTISSLINLAGGFTPYADINNIQLYHPDSNGELVQVLNSDNKTSLARSSKVVVLDKKLIVQVEGNVYNPGQIVFKENKRLNYLDYIQLAGGYKQKTSKKSVYVKSLNGEINKLNNFIKKRRPAKYGDIIFVPAKENVEDFNTSEFVADLATVLANLASILFIADRVSQ